MSHTVSNTESKTWAYDLVGITLFCLLFYTRWLGHSPLFIPDEARYCEIAREMLASHDFITPRINGVAFLDKPAFFYWLQAGAIFLFGIKEWALRFFPMLVGVWGVLYTYITGRVIFNRQSGLLAALILMTSPLYYSLSHFANMDLEVAVLISSSLYSFLIALHASRPKQTLFYLAFIFAAFAFLTKGLMAIVFPFMIISLWVILLNQWQKLKKIPIIRGSLLFIIVAMPWFLLVERANPGFLTYFFYDQQVSRFLATSGFNSRTPFWFYLPVIFLGFFPWIIFFLTTVKKNLLRYQKKTLVCSQQIFLLIWIGGIFIFFSIPHSKTLGYILPVFPALALITGHFVSNHLREIYDRSLNKMIIVIFSLVASLLIVFESINWFELPPIFFNYLHLIDGLLLVTCIFLIYRYRKTSLRQLFTILFLCNIGLLLILTKSAVHLNKSTLKPLSLILKSQIKPTDEVIHYLRFYPDTLLYLEKKVTIVGYWHTPIEKLKDNWERELRLGMPFQSTDNWLINLNEFWQRWQSEKRIYVFLLDRYFNDFKKKAANFYELGKYHDVRLLTNQPPHLSAHHL